LLTLILATLGAKHFMNNPILDNDIPTNPAIPTGDSLPKSELGEITLLAQQLKDLNNEIAEAEIQVSTLKDRRKHVAEELLPELMAKQGLKLLQLETGAKIQVDDFVDARIKDPNVAFSWLRETGNDSIIKNKIELNFERNQDTLAQEIINKLKREHDIDADVKIAVHHATLKSFCREALENEELSASLPREAFGIYEGKRAKLTN